MYKILSCICVLTFCKIVHGQFTVPPMPDCMNKIENDVEKCANSTSHLNKLPDTSDPKKFCCAMWVTIDCTAKKEKVNFQE